MLVYFGKQFVSLRCFLLIGCMLPIPFYLLKINLYHNLISCVSTDPLAPILLAPRRDNTAPFAAPRPPVYTLRSVSPSPRGAHLTSPPPISVTGLIHHRDPHVALVLPRIPSPGPIAPGAAQRRVVGVAASPHRYRRSNGPGPLPVPSPSPSPHRLSLCRATVARVTAVTFPYCRAHLRRHRHRRRRLRRPRRRRWKSSRGASVQPRLIHLNWTGVGSLTGLERVSSSGRRRLRHDNRRPSSSTTLPPPRDPPTSGDGRWWCVCGGGAFLSRSDGRRQVVRWTE